MLPVSQAGVRAQDQSSPCAVKRHTARDRLRSPAGATGGAASRRAASARDRLRVPSTDACLGCRYIDSQMLGARHAFPARPGVPPISRWHAFLGRDGASPWIQGLVCDAHAAEGPVSLIFANASNIRTAACSGVHWWLLAGEKSVSISRRPRATDP